MVNLGGCKTLEKMKIWFYPDQDFSEIGQLNRLEELTMIQCKTLTLDGITDMPALKQIELKYSRTLQNIDALANCPNLDLVWIEKCSQLININLKSASISRLLLDRVANLNFLPQLPNLKRLLIADLKDGNMQPILDCTDQLESVGLYPTKRPHYQYSERELHALLDAKKAR